MILFTEPNAAFIRCGVKTATRRRGKKRWNSGTTRKCYLQLPISGARPFAQVYIDRVYAQPLGAMTEADAKKEGNYTLAAFRKGWAEMHGSWDEKEEVWVIEFHLLRSQMPAWKIGTRGRPA